MIYIPASFSMLRKNYPARVPDPKNPGSSILPVKELQAFMDTLPPGNTPCCVQISHALNLSGERIPQNNPGGRRANSLINVKEGSFYYILAVDELEVWLTQKYGAGLDVRKFAGLSASSNDMGAMKRQLGLVKGVIVFRSTSGAGVHTELWDGNQILQRDMAEAHLFSQPRILFWCCDTSIPT